MTLELSLRMLSELAISTGRCNAVDFLSSQLCFSIIYFLRSGEACTFSVSVCINNFHELKLNKIHGHILNLFVVALALSVICLNDK